MSEADSRINGGMQGMAAESGKSYGAMKGGAGGGDDGKMNELYKINQIYFRMIPTLSLVAKRTLLVNQAQRTQYTGVNDTIIFNFNTGEYYVSMPSSYLYIQAGYNDPTAFEYAKALISQGNVMSLFEEISFTTASGTETCRELNKGLHDSFSYRYNNTQEYIDTIGALQGAPTGEYSRLHDGVAPVWGTLDGDVDTIPEKLFPTLGGSDGIVKPWSGSASRVAYGLAATNLNVHSVNSAGAEAPALGFVEFCVPMDQVLGIFKPYLATLFPAGALSGGRLELRLKSTLQSLQFAGSCVEQKTLSTTGIVVNGNLTNLVNRALTAFQVNRTYLVLDSYQLQDNVLKRLNEVSAGQDGLTVLFDTYDQVITPFQGQGSVECQVQQARSRIVRSWNVVRDTQMTTNPYVNSFAAEAAILRVAAKVGPGSTGGPALTATTNNAVGLGGGLNYVVQLNTTGTQATTLTQGIPHQALYQYQPKLPADPFTQNPQTTVLWGTPSVASYQAQLGALFFPQQPITSVDEHYQNALYVMGKGVPDKDNTCSVTREDFYGGVGNNLIGLGTAISPAGNTNPTDAHQYGQWVAPYGLAIYGMVAEKSQMLQLSGLPISNARLLRHKFTFAYPSRSNNREITTFTQFTRVMKVFLGGRVVVRE